MKTDKILHLLSGYAITITIGLWLPVWGLVLGVLAGLGKEIIWDGYMKRGTSEVIDAAMTIAGSALAFIFLLIAK